MQGEGGKGKGGENARSRAKLACETDSSSQRDATTSLMERQFLNEIIRINLFSQALIQYLLRYRTACRPNFSAFFFRSAQ